MKNTITKIISVVGLFACISFAIPTNAQTVESKSNTKSETKTSNLLVIPKTTLKTKEDKSVPKERIPSKKNIKEGDLIRSLDRFSLLNERFETFFDKNKDALDKIDLAKTEIKTAKDQIDTTDKDIFATDEEIKMVKDALTNARKYLADAIRIARKGQSDDNEDSDNKSE